MLLSFMRLVVFSDGTLNLVTALLLDRGGRGSRSLASPSIPAPLLQAPEGSFADVGVGRNASVAT